MTDLQAPDLERNIAMTQVWWARAYRELLAVGVANPEQYLIPRPLNYIDRIRAGRD